jgi:hypothetical protein
VAPEVNLRAALVGLERRLSSQGQRQGQREKRLAFLETQQDGRVLRNREACVSTSCRQIFGVGTGKARLCKINLEEEHGEFLDWFRPSGE